MPGKRDIKKSISVKEQRRARKHKAAARDIFFAAARVINKNHSTSLEKVAEELGGTRGTIYYYFKTKGELLYKMQSYLHDQVKKALEPIIQDERLSELQKLKKAIFAYSVVELEHHELVRALWSDASLYEQPPKMREATMQRVNYFYEQIEKLIIDACQAEELRTINTKVAARMIINMPDAICRWYQVGSGKLTAKQIADYIIEVVFWGFFLPYRGVRRQIR